MKTSCNSTVVVLFLPCCYILTDRKGEMMRYYEKMDRISGIMIICLAMLSMHMPKAFSSPPYINAQFTHIYCLQSDWTFKDLMHGGIASVIEGVPTFFNLTFSYSGMTSGYIYTTSDSISGNNIALPSIGSSSWDMWTYPYGFGASERYEITFQLCWWDGIDRISSIRLDKKTVEIHVSDNQDVAYLKVYVVGAIGQPLYDADVRIRNEQNICVYDNKASAGLMEDNIYPSSVDVILPYGIYYIEVEYKGYRSDLFRVDLLTPTGSMPTMKLPIFLEIFGQVWTFQTFVFWICVIEIMIGTSIAVMQKYRKKSPKLHEVSRTPVVPVSKGLCPRCGNELEQRGEAFWCQHCGWVAPSDVITDIY